MQRALRSQRLHQVRVLASCLLTSVLFASAQAADCPSSCTFWSPYGEPYSGWYAYYCSAENTFSQYANRGECFYEVGYDAPQGSLHLLSGAGFNACYYRLVHTDEFRLEGVPPGTYSVTVRLDARLVADGWNGGEGHVEILSPEAGSASWDSYFEDRAEPPPHAERESTLTLEVNVEAGVPFQLSFTLDTGAHGESSATADAAFSFEGLPEGAVILSCRGYVQGSVPTKPATWGRIKSQYR